MAVGPGCRLRAVRSARPPAAVADPRAVDDDRDGAVAAAGRRRHRPARLARPPPQRLRCPSGRGDRRPRCRHARRERARAGQRDDVWLVVCRHDARRRGARPRDGQLRPSHCRSRARRDPGCHPRRRSGHPRAAGGSVLLRVVTSVAGRRPCSPRPRPRGSPLPTGGRHGAPCGATNGRRRGAHEDPPGAALCDDDGAHVQATRLVGGPLRRGERRFWKSPRLGRRGRRRLPRRLHRPQNDRRRRQFDPRRFLDPPRGQAFPLGVRDDDLRVVRDPRSLPGVHVGVALRPLHAGLDAGGGRDAVHRLDGTDESGHELWFVARRPGERLVRCPDNVPRRRSPPADRGPPPPRRPLQWPWSRAACRRFPTPPPRHPRGHERGRPAVGSSPVDRPDPGTDSCPAGHAHRRHSSPGRSRASP